MLYNANMDHIVAFLNAATQFWIAVPLAVAVTPALCMLMLFPDQFSKQFVTLGLAMGLVMTVFGVFAVLPTAVPELCRATGLLAPTAAAPTWGSTMHQGMFVFGVVGVGTLVSWLLARLLPRIPTQDTSAS